MMQLSTCLKTTEKVSKLIIFLLLSYVPVAYAGGNGDAISHYFFSDLVPLLALFGGQVTRQFMSRSTGSADDILLAMAPIGILNIVVSAIRVRGPQWLKYTIGRACERDGAAEVELMPTTSSNVCELWNGHKLVRVLGSPDLVELVYRVDDRGVFVADPNGGIFDLKGAVSEGLCRPKSRTGPEIHSSMKEAPNLQLNICETKVGKLELWVYAAIGVILQIVVLEWCVLVVTVWKYPKGGDPVKPFALSLTIVGTLLVCLGVMLCSHVVGASKTDTIYEIIDGNTAQTTDSDTLIEEPLSDENKLMVHSYPGTARTVYLQRGGQMVCDQHFEAHAIYGPDRDWSRTKKREIKTSRMNHKNLEWLVLFATIITMVGFIAQFTGFRAMHWSCTIAELLAMAIMAIIRVAARRGLSPPVHDQRITTGWEMVYLAKDLTRNLVWVVDTGNVDFRKCIPAHLVRSRSHSAEDALLLLQRLHAIIDWDRPSRKVAVSTAKAMEDIMNILYNENCITLCQSSLETSELSFEIPIYVKDRYSIDDADPYFSTVKLKIKRRQNTVTGVWGPWLADIDQLEAILGLWMFDQHNLQVDWDIAETAHSDPRFSKGEPIDHEEILSLLVQAQKAALRGEGGFTRSRTGMRRSRKIFNRISQFGIVEGIEGGTGHFLQTLGRFDEQRLEDYEFWLEIPTTVTDEEAGITRCGIRVWDDLYVQLQADTSNSKFAFRRHDCFGFEFGPSDSGPVRPVPQNTIKIPIENNQLWDPQPVKGIMSEEDFMARDKSMDILVRTTCASRDDMFGLDLVSKFLWTAVDSIEAIHGVTHRRIVDHQYDDTTFVNSVLEDLVQSIVGAGLGDQQDAYAILIPPLSASEKLPYLATPERIKQRRAMEAIERILAN